MTLLAPVVLFLLHTSRNGPHRDTAKEIVADASGTPASAEKRAGIPRETPAVKSSDSVSRLPATTKTNRRNPDGRGVPHEEDTGQEPKPGPTKSNDSRLPAVTPPSVNLDNDDVGALIRSARQVVENINRETQKKQAESSPRTTKPESSSQRPTEPSKPDKSAGTEITKDGTKPKSRRPSGSRPTDPVDRDRAIARHARQAPREVEQSLEVLAAYLIGPVRNEREKAWAIYCWIADRIAYNAEAFLAGRLPKDTSANAVLASRLTVCDGYANLFRALCNAAGVACVKVIGDAKGYGFIPGDKVAVNHAWNLVKVDGILALVDVTWGSGYIGQAKEFVKRFDDFYFLTPPEQLIFNHLPYDARCQLLDPLVSVEDYPRWPKVDKQLLKFGVDVRSIHDKLNEKSFRGFVETYLVDGLIRVHEAPLEKHLKAGQSYRFLVESPDCSLMTVFNNEERHVCNQDKTKFSLTLSPREGKLQLSGLFEANGGTYQTFLQYSVESDAAASKSAMSRP